MSDTNLLHMDLLRPSCCYIYSVDKEISPICSELAATENYEPYFTSCDHLDHYVPNYVNKSICDITCFLPVVHPDVNVPLLNSYLFEMDHHLLNCIHVPYHSHVPNCTNIDMLNTFEAGIFPAPQIVPDCLSQYVPFLNVNNVGNTLYANNEVCKPFLPDSTFEPVTTNFNNNNVVTNSSLPSSKLEPVINLSSFQLTPAMISLLSKGLTFCPTPPAADRYTLRKDLDKFHTSLRRKQFFEKSTLSTLDLNSTDLIIPDTPSDDEDEPFDHFKFKLPSTWSPMGPFHLESYITLNEFALNKHTLPAPSRQNLSSDEKKALAELEKAHDIIIKPADKGSAVVIQNLEDYLKEGYRQLNDPAFYVETKDDLTHLHNELITQLVTHLAEHEQISEKCSSYLINKSPRTPQLYLLPKIHKNKTPVPGRPIVSANNSPTERISQLADFFLQPLVQTTKSFVKDTTDFINKIEALPPLTPDSLLCTIDVCSLYTNIPNDEGITACQSILNKYRRTTQAPSNETIIHLLEYVLYMNNFDFNDKHYLQVGGTAMGTKVAPSLANIFMANFEDTHVYPYPTKPAIWLRYIDDIFMVWNHGNESLNQFLTHLNLCHKTIKFTSDISPESINFLDTTIKIDTNRKLYTDLYCKPTDSHNYLLYESAHPKHIKRSLPYSQFLRIRRICSKLDDFDRNAASIAQHFIRRNYPPHQIEDALIKVRRKSREELLLPPTKPTKQGFSPDLYLISTFDPETTPLKDIVLENWPLLGRTNNTDTIFSKRIIHGYRRNKNLKDTLVHAKIPKPPVNPKTLLSRSLDRRCKAKNCRYCPKLDKTGKITCTTTGKIYTSKHHITCNSNNVIYCITCTKCLSQYVGQTKNSIKERFKAHFYSIKEPNKSNTVVGRHFSSPDHEGLSNVTIHVLDFILSPSESPASQRQRDDTERTWIHKLVSTAPYGLNVAD